ncbi:MAG: patatin-like phospholipase family protein [Candidatus Cloacimonetes bacterium]|jgi:NTE family protein|nr:patatin-like phospholipase family protein [Candidatus Cloacimonadota bacterium]MBT6994746.1 patatin-like phospholipase family protein [Candidatus Cloacimonadota bacterium]MBT7469017.1 patatin-like phospholipase family protein [Candidatus Cloacimonadota bacterium]
MKKIGLTLGGGGARGIAHIEFLKILDKNNIVPSVISGTSIGALIGAFYAAGFSANEISALIDEIDLNNMQKKRDAFAPQKMSEIGKEIAEFVSDKFSEIKEFYCKIDEIKKMIDFSFLNFSSFLKGKGVEKYLQENLPVQTFEDLEIPLKIVATDFWSGEKIVFDSGDLVPAIRASISIPAIFEPYIFQDRVLVDGGISDNLPFELIKDLCDFLIAIDVSGSRSILPDLQIPNMFDSVISSFEIMQSKMIEKNMQNSAPNIYVKPNLVDIGILDFHKVNEIMEDIQSDLQKFDKQMKPLKI